MIFDIWTIGEFLLFVLYGSWLSFAIGWIDSGHGVQRYHQGTRNDIWHLVRRYGIMWPALIFPELIALCPTRYLAFTSLVPLVVTSRMWFRYAVRKNEKYDDWYQKDFTWLGALYKDK